jgi:hypothetical protein
MTASEWSDSARSRSNYIQDIALRVDASAKDLDLEVRRALADVDSHLAVVRVATPAEQLRRNFNQERMVARLTGFFGLLAPACVGCMA